MKKLTKENIQFIDRYLKSEITFTDIRAEMVDHVASSIEQKMNNDNQRTFYNVFKDYMIENKKVLLKSNKKFIRAADIRVLRYWLKLILSFKGLLMLVVTYLSFFTLGNLLETEEFYKLIKNAPILILCFLGLIYFVFLRGKRNNRFSATERVGFLFLIFYQFTNIFLNLKNERFNFILENENILVLIASILVMFSVGLLFTAIKFKKYYNLKFSLE